MAFDDDFRPSKKDGMGHKCGVFAVYGLPDAAAVAAAGIDALQHRGEEACGVVSYDRASQTYHIEHHTGFVGDTFGKDPGILLRLKGDVALGHNRYSTSGRLARRNIQPMFAEPRGVGLALAHNGNLTNAKTLHDELVRAGALFQSTMDTEVLLHLASRSEREDPVGRLIDALRQVEGGFAIAALVDGKLIGARDPWGLRPLVLGELDGAPVLASETYALDRVEANFVRNIEAGEVVVISEAGIESLTPFPQRPCTPCVFEYVYFARPDSIMHGRSVYGARYAFGELLSRVEPVDADVVCAVPDGGNPAALGYSDASGIRLGHGLIRSHYGTRSFIQPDQIGRQRLIARKHAPNRFVIEGKRIILVDDSIVRGNTCRQIVRMLQRAGAAEIHLRVACPPIRFPDFYGIDMPSREELIASAMSKEQMIEYFNVDSLAFLPIDDFYRGLGEEGRNNKQPQFADHCFTGDYPTPLADRDSETARKEHQLLLIQDE